MPFILIADPVSILRVGIPYELGSAVFTENPIHVRVVFLGKFRVVSLILFDFVMSFPIGFPIK